jgi:hypothetical protein
MRSLACDNVPLLELVDDQEVPARHHLHLEAPEACQKLRWIHVQYGCHLQSNRVGRDSQEVLHGSKTIQGQGTCAHATYMLSLR